MGYVCEICGKPLSGRLRKFCPECAKNPCKSTRIKEKDKIKKTKGYVDRDVLASKGNTKQCCTCEYWDNLHLLCDYYGKTGQLRLCDGSPNCKKYKREMKGGGSDA